MMRFCNISSLLFVSLFEIVICQPESVHWRYHPYNYDYDNLLIDPKCDITNECSGIAYNKKNDDVINGYDIKLCQNSIDESCSMMLETYSNPIGHDLSYNLYGTIIGDDYWYKKPDYFVGCKLKSSVYMINHNIHASSIKYQEDYFKNMLGDYKILNGKFILELNRPISYLDEFNLYIGTWDFINSQCMTVPDIRDMKTIEYLIPTDPSNFIEILNPDSIIGQGNALISWDMKNTQPENILKVTNFQLQHDNMFITFKGSKIKTSSVQQNIQLFYSSLLLPIFYILSI